MEPHFLTDLVWSLCVLQQAKAPYLQRVLAPDFHAQIRGEVGVCAGGMGTENLGQGVGILNLLRLNDALPSTLSWKSRAPRHSLLLCSGTARVLPPRPREETGGLGIS